MSTEQTTTKVAGVEKKQLPFREHSIYYETRGSGERALVFIHGWSSSIASWKHQLDSFPGHKVIAIDLPGNGKSSRNQEAAYNLKLFADSVQAVLQKESVEKAVFLGHSMGFSVAEVVSQKYPELCEALICVDGTHFELPESEEEREGWLAYNRNFAESLTAEEGRDAFINALLLPNTPAILKDEVFKTVRTVPLSIGSAMVAVLENDLRYLEKRVMDIPCLAIHSPVFQLSEDYKKDFRTMYPGVEYHEIEGVSHFLMLETPYKVNQLIHDFLGKLS